MKGLNKLRIIAGIVLFIGIAPAAFTEAHAEKMRAAYTAIAGNFTVLWVGKEARLYEANGVDLELLFISSSPKAVQALIGGDLEIIYTAAGAIVDANLAGADLVMVGCQYDTGISSFFTVPSVTKVEDLKGKIIGLTRFGSFTDFVARHILRKHRLQPAKDVALLQVGGVPEIVAAMQNNLVQAGAISLPSSLMAKKIGLRELLKPAEVGLPFDYGCLTVKRPFLRTRRDELKKILRATIAAYDLTIQDPVLAKKVLTKYTRTTDPEILEATYKEQVKDFALRIPYVSLPGLTSIIEFRAEMTPKVKKLAVEKMFDNSLLQELLKEIPQTK